MFSFRCILDLDCLLQASNSNMVPFIWAEATVSYTHRGESEVGGARRGKERISKQDLSLVKCL